MEAIWGLDYDLTTDKCYNRPCCPECGFRTVGDEIKAVDVHEGVKKDADN